MSGYLSLREEGEKKGREGMGPILEYAELHSSPLWGHILDKAVASVFSENVAVLSDSYLGI